MLSRVFLLLIIATSTFATNYSLPPLSEIEQQQLSWLEQHSNKSFDLDALVINNEQHIEHQRAIVRLRCMHLLRIGDMCAYNLFVASQRESILQYADFIKLSVYIKKLSKGQYQQLRKAIILTAVSLSPVARAKLPEVEVLYSNLEFSVSAVRSNPQNKYLFSIFPPGTNFRHMLYAEGGQEMFMSLRAMILHKYMRQDELDLWFAYWIVDIAGFRGHVAPDGSIYLNQDVYSAMATLKKMLDTMLVSPTYDVLTPYLDYRAELLGLQELEKETRHTLAHLGAQMRLYTPAQGRIIYEVFQNIPTESKNILITYFAKQEHTHDRLTHVPSLFANALIQLDGDLELMIEKMLPIYIKIIQLGGLDVSCNKISSSLNIAELLQNPKAQLDIDFHQEICLVP